MKITCSLPLLLILVTFLPSQAKAGSLLLPTPQPCNERTYATTNCEVIVEPFECVAAVDILSNKTCSYDDDEEMCVPSVDTCELAQNVAGALCGSLEVAPTCIGADVENCSMYYEQATQLRCFPFLTESGATCDTLPARCTPPTPTSTSTPTSSATSSASTTASSSVTSSTSATTTSSVTSSNSATATSSATPSSSGTVSGTQTLTPSASTEPTLSPSLTPTATPIPPIVGVSITSGGEFGNGDSTQPSLSGDGQFVAFDSTATNLVAGDSNGFRDIFIRDLATGTTELVSVSSAGQQANGNSERPSVSYDGRFVSFQSSASNLISGDTNGVVDIFLRDRQAGTTIRVSIGDSGQQATKDCLKSAVSGDGQRIVFISRSQTLTTASATFGSGHENAFLRDLRNETTYFISRNLAGGTASVHTDPPNISQDGQYALFTSNSALLPGTVSASLSYAYNMNNHSLFLASLRSDGTIPSQPSQFGKLSLNGRYVVFLTGDASVVPGGPGLVGFQAPYVRDLVSGNVYFGAPDPSGYYEDFGLSFYNAYLSSVSNDGDVVFCASSVASPPEDLNGSGPDLYFYNRAAGNTTMISVNASGIGANQPMSFTDGGSVSADGKFVAFATDATNLASGSTGGHFNVYVVYTKKQ